MTRVISTLLQKLSVKHRVHVGSLDVEAVGHIPHHWWIDLADGRLCDLRARMWLGADDRVPHGVFHPGQDAKYVHHGTVPLESVRLPRMVFIVLAGKAPEEFAPLEGWK